MISFKMKEEDYDTDFYVLQKMDNKHLYIDIFNFYSTVECLDFMKYHNMREKLPNHKPKAFNAMFGLDFVRHFEIAYQIIRKLDGKPHL